MLSRKVVSSVLIVSVVLLSVGSELGAAQVRSVTSLTPAEGLAYAAKQEATSLEALEQKGGESDAGAMALTILVVLFVLGAIAASAGSSS